jgi:hypothetical protein
MVGILKKGLVSDTFSNYHGRDGHVSDIDNASDNYCGN